MNKISNILKLERIKQGISQEELANRIGCTSRTIRYWEEGKRVPSLELADKALNALGVSLTIGKAKEK